MLELNGIRIGQYGDCWDIIQLDSGDIVGRTYMDNGDLEEWFKSQDVENLKQYIKGDY